MVLSSDDAWNYVWVGTGRPNSGGERGFKVSGFEVSVSKEQSININNLTRLEVELNGF